MALGELIVGAMPVYARGGLLLVDVRWRTRQSPAAHTGQWHQARSVSQE